MGRPIATNGDLLHSCVEVCEPIELLFGVVSGLGREMGVLDGVHLTQGEGDVFGVFIGFNSRLVLPSWFLPFWYLVTRLVPDKFQKSSKTIVCVCVCVFNS